MAASKAGELATVFSLNSDDVVFMFPRRETFGKEELAAGSKAMAGVQIDRTSEIVDLQALADWGWMRTACGSRSRNPAVSRWSGPDTH